jgi:hypothetical protein
MTLTNPVATIPPAGGVRPRVALAMLGALALASAAPEGGGGVGPDPPPADGPSVIHIQVWLHAPGRSLRVRFDGRLIYDGPAGEPAKGDASPAPREVGRFPVPPGSRHRLDVSADGAGPRTRLVWAADRGERWVVVDASERPEPPAEPLTITLTLQEAPAASK